MAARNLFAALCYLGCTELTTPLKLPGRLSSPPKTERVDVCIVGGGMSGLAAALELKRRGRDVTVLSRDLAQAATMAAGGMLAPQAERLEEGPLLDMCVAARDGWPRWLDSLDAPRPTLRAAGGFVSPLLPDQLTSWQPPEAGGPAEWLDGRALRAMEPSLSKDVRGGWWFPLETWVDPVEAHACALRTCEAAGVDVRQHVDVTGLELGEDGCAGVRYATAAGDAVIEARDVCVAAGAWLKHLLPIPVTAQKGQMVALKAPTPEVAAGAPSRVVYGDGCYLIPRGGRVVVGATVETSETVHNDVRGLRALLEKATALCPGLDDWEVDDAWAGLRPTTTDGAPVLGRTRWPNLWVAGGYWRNGILLAPTAARLLADAMEGTLSAADAELLDACRWDRFFAPVSPGSARLREGHAPLTCPPAEPPAEPVVV
eukprot:CAMPEP_0119271546 /NCGR_PEP_ID=MMETSP1329-20130426/8097_1 /TAXON_ID=114041 /ORGANISM="Genus nov. species nov., Strain RCC1024" /LENGTH=428 /DNA_ID=CAMNT_0007271595 /DNA_START=94 /DNA_END=1376 /DNA_ORIENTATION=+